jgi:hypothetical protein
MQFIVYIAVLLVSISSILLELDWLTKPKLETKPAVHATSAPPPVPRVVAKADGPNAELNPVYPKKGAPQANETSTNVPQSAASLVTPPPATAPQPTTAMQAAEAMKLANAAQPATEPPRAAPQTANAPQTVAPAVVAPTGNATATVAAETTGKAEPAQPPRQAASANAAAETTAPPPPQPDAKQANASNPAPAAPEQAPANASNARVAEKASVATKRQCDVSACAAAYHSFRESDCTYQPFEGERRVCVAPPSAQQRSADRGPRREADPRLARAAQDPDRNVDWRATSHTRAPAVDDADDDDYDAPRPPGRVMIERGYGRWP